MDGLLHLIQGELHKLTENYEENVKFKDKMMLMHQQLQQHYMLDHN